MANKKYEKLKVRAFGQDLIESNDLDPIYVALVSSQLEPDTLKRWLVAYWCFYHAGVASYLSEFTGKDFWGKFLIAAENVIPSPINKRWERGHERRHFRAANAIKAHAYLSGRYERPEQMVDYIVGHDTPLTFLAVTKRAKEHHGFGDWIAFKVADMIDRVLGIPVDFDNTAVFMFEQPVKSALLLIEMGEIPLPPNVESKADKLNYVADYLIEYFSDLLAPPFLDRPVNIQEIETVLCKWKSHYTGSYPLRNDIDEINRGIIEWAEVSPIAKTFMENMPK